MHRPIHRIFKTSVGNICQEELKREEQYLRMDVSHCKQGRPLQRYGKYSLYGSSLSFGNHMEDSLIHDSFDAVLIRST